MGNICVRNDTTTAAEGNISIESSTFTDLFHENEASDKYTHFVLPQAYLQDGQVTLNLSNKALDDLPPQVLSLRKLERLDLRANKIRSLPYNISYLQSLQEISLRQNSLEYLPAQICTLANLEILDLSFNNLHNLPYCIGHMKRLRKLVLSCNCISGLPISLKYLDQLTMLNLEGNEMDIFPEVLCEVTTLEVLVLSDNEIKKIPDGIMQLFNLKELYLDDNKLLKLSNNLRLFFLSLDVIDINNNGLNFISNTLYNKTNENTRKAKEAYAQAPFSESTGIPRRKYVDTTMVYSRNQTLRDTYSDDIFVATDEPEIVPSRKGKLNKLEKSGVKMKNGVRKINKQIRPKIRDCHIFFRALQEAKVLPKFKKRKRKKPRKLKDDKKDPERYVTSQYTWRGWRVDITPQSNRSNPRPPPSQSPLPTPDLYDELGHLKELSSMLPAVKLDDNGTATLDMSWHELNFVPGSVFELNNINKLNLSNNSIRVLPEDVSQLRNLHTLYISGNNLREVPTHINLLSSLRFLDLSANHLTCLPDWFPDLSKLQHLNLNDNNLPGIPCEAFVLVRLQVLRVCGNEIREISDKITLLENLVELCANKNKIHSLSSGLSCLKQLRILDLGENMIGDENLKHICSTLHVKELNLSKNNIFHIPEAFSQLVNLEKLNISKNRIENLPRSFSLLSNMLCLDVHGNDLTTLPESLCKLPSLEVLLASRNKITGLPDIVRCNFHDDMSKLIELDISNNDVKKIPHAIGSLRKLEILNVSGNHQLRHLPKSIIDMTSLNLLFVDKTVRIPHELYKQKHLQILSNPDPSKQEK